MFLHVSVCPQGGIHSPSRYTPRQVHPPAGTLPQQAHLPGRYPRAGTPPREQCMLGDTGNKRAVRIPLECILISNESVVSIQVTSTALRCCLWILRFPLPSLKTNIKSITNSLFVLLNNYASPGAANEGTDNFELIVTCFKVQFMEKFSRIMLALTSRGSRRDNEFVKVYTYRLRGRHRHSHSLIL